MYLCKTISINIIPHSLLLGYKTIPEMLSIIMSKKPLFKVPCQAAFE